MSAVELFIKWLYPLVSLNKHSNNFVHKIYCNTKRKYSNKYIELFHSSKVCTFSWLDKLITVLPVLSVVRNIWGKRVFNWFNSLRVKMLVRGEPNEVLSHGYGMSIYCVTFVCLWIISIAHSMNLLHIESIVLNSRVFQTRNKSTITLTNSSHERTQNRIEQKIEEKEWVHSAIQCVQR